jgi:hypothetical protein
MTRCRHAACAKDAAEGSWYCQMHLDELAFVLGGPESQCQRCGAAMVQAVWHDCPDPGPR